MKIKILITGVTGTGKSTISDVLRKGGYDACDIEAIDGMFKVHHISTGKIFSNFDNSNPKHLHDADWICDVTKLKKLFGEQKSEVAYYCGIASNMDEVAPLFDKIIVLQPDKKTLNERLRKDREGTKRLGHNQEGRDVVLGWKDWWEGEMKKKGAIFVNANKSTEEVAKEILNLSSKF